MKANFSCIIIEDEAPAADIIELYIGKVEVLSLAGRFTTAIKAMSFLHANHVDLIFADINLPGISGIDLLKSMNTYPGVIITTAYPEYAVEGFELNVIDYLLKPISFERFLKAVNRFLKLNQISEYTSASAAPEPNKAFVFFRSENKNVKVFIDDIYYLEAQKNYVLIYECDRIIRVYGSISEMEEKMPGQSFLRIHRSFIVALNKIAVYTSEYIEMLNKKIPVGRYYRLNFTTRFQRK